jgi:superfamily II DNA or RNA helicase
MHHGLPAPGSALWLRQKRWRVTRAWRDDALVRLDVVDGDDHRSFLVPFDRPVIDIVRSRPRRVNRRRLQARVGAWAAHAIGTRHLRTLLSADADILPHQLSPVLAILRGQRRALIADAVGLGKTIQAALIVSELLARDARLRALLLVPTCLHGQWTTELSRRFGVPVNPGDRAGLDSLARDGLVGANPWERPGVWLASLDFVKQPHVASAMGTRPWDLLIVDEAHDACGASDRYDVCTELARQSHRVVLLTATPHSGDGRRFGRLHALGALRGQPGGPDASASDRMLIFRRSRAVHATSPPRRVRWISIEPAAAERHLMSVLRDFERFAIARTSLRTREGVLLFLSVLRKRAVSTALALTRTLDRRLAWLADPARPAELDAIQPSLAFEDDDSEYGTALHIDLELGAGLERTWLGRLRLAAREAMRAPSKLQHLSRLLARTRDAAVVFTEFRDSLEAVVGILPAGCRYAMLHGAQTSLEQRAALSTFLDGQARVLVTTDVAAQGLNLQARAHWVVSLELPWRPSRLEQRIGRVDFSLLLWRHRAEASLLASLARQTLTAKHTLGPTVLDVVNASDHAVASALLMEDGETIAGASGAFQGDALMLARIDDRPERRLAAQLRLCRRALTLWRAPADDLHRPWMSSAGVHAMRTPPDGHARLIFVAAIVNDRDEPVEDHIVEVGMSGWDPHEMVACTRLASASLSLWIAPRVRRLGARLARREAGDRRARRAVENDMDQARQFSPSQPGMFSGRLAVELERVAGERGLVLQVADVPPAPPPSDPAGRQARVRLAPPRLVAVFAAVRTERM